MTLLPALERLSPRLLERRSDRRLEVPTWVAALAVIGAALVYLIVAWGNAVPALWLDEINMLGNSRVLAGTTPEWELVGPGYMPGLALLMAPFWWFTSSAQAVYVAGLALTSVIALLTIWPLSKIVHHYGVSQRVAVVLASLIMVSPARSFLSNFMLSDSLLLLTICLVFLSARRLAADWALSSALILGLTTAASVLAHGRGVSVAIAVGLWCLYHLRQGRKSALILAVSTGLALSIGAFLLYRWLSESLYRSDTRLSIDQRIYEQDILDIAGTVSGQLWYLTLAWPLIAIAGVALVVHRWRLDPVSRLIVIAAVMTFALSVQQMQGSDTFNRLDTWFYGRYNDAVWTVIAAIGLALLTRVRWPAFNLLAVLGTVVVGAAMYLLQVPQIPKEMFWQAVHVPGVAPWLSTGNYSEQGDQNWMWLSTLPTLIAALFALLALVRFWLIPVLALMWVTLGLLHDQGTADLLVGDRSVNADPLGVSDLPQSARLGATSDLQSGANALVFFADQRQGQVALVDGPDAVGQVDLLWGSYKAPGPLAAGAKVHSERGSGSIVLWVYPGTVFDELASQGKLQDKPDWLVED